MSVLAVSAIYEAPAASAYHGQVTEVWSATLTVQDLGGTRGCDNSSSNSSLHCSSMSILTDDDFTYGGVDYTVSIVYIYSGALVITFDVTVHPHYKAATPGVR